MSTEEQEEMLMDELSDETSDEAHDEASEDQTEEQTEEQDEAGEELTSEDDLGIKGTELESFEAAAIEDVEVLSEEQIASIVESSVFFTDKPISIATIKQSFKGTTVRSKDIRAAIDRLQKEYLETPQRGITLEEVAGGFQLRTKVDNMKYLRQSVKARPFRLSGPALEVMSICAYKQPVTKAQIDEIRGVESGHLLRALMEKHLLTFGERSDLPGKPMFYETTRKFLEIFGLRNIQELPSLHEIDQLIPDGIGEIEDKETLSDLTGQLSQAIGSTYSEGEDELLKITDELSHISTSSEFFEVEKNRQRDRRDLERAQNIREALVIGEAVDEKDQRWLIRYDLRLQQTARGIEEVDFVTDGIEETETPAQEVPPPEEMHEAPSEEL
jgi:segregation and condensation protein B